MKKRYCPFCPRPYTKLCDGCVLAEIADLLKILVEVKVS